MPLRARILRDLLSGQSTVLAMALRFEVPTVDVRQACEDLELDLLVESALVGSAFTVFRLTPAGRDEAAAIPTH